MNYYSLLLITWEFGGFEGYFHFLLSLPRIDWASDAFLDLGFGVTDFSGSRGWSSMAGVLRLTASFRVASFDGLRPQFCLNLLTSTHEIMFYPRS
jgi:hypothetical protein